MARVLIIEDKPFAARKLCLLLMSRGVSDIMHAASASRAGELLRTHPDWVILDLGLPDGAALVVLEAIRKASRPIRVVALSAAADDPLLARCESYGPTCVILLPSDPGSWSEFLEGPFEADGGFV